MPMANPQARRTAKPLSLFPPTKELSDWTNADIKKKARVNPRVSEDRLRTRVNTARKAAGKKPLLTVDQQVKAQRAEAKAKSEANRKASGWTQPQKTPSKTPSRTTKTPSRTTKTPSKTTKAGAAKKAKTSFRERRAARLERRIAQPWGSEERKKLQRKRLKRVKGRMAEGGDVKKKSGGAVKKQRGGELTRMASGEPIQWQSGPTGQRRRMDYRNYVTPGVAKRQLAKQEAAGGPGRRAVRGAGGAKDGGLIARMNRGGSAQNIVDWFNEQTSHWTPQQRAANQARVAASNRRGQAKRQLKKAPPPTRVSVRGPGMKSGGAVKKYQSGGLSRAQQNMLRQAQEYAASSGQNPAALRKLTAQHGDLYGAGQQRKAASQMAGNQPGRSAMRGIGPGMKKGGMAKQGANARLDESLGERRGKESKKSQSLKSRRNESRGARKKSKPQSAGVAKRGWGAAIR